MIRYVNRLNQAIETGDMETVKLLLERGVSVTKNDRQGYTPLLVSAYCGNTEAIKLLFDLHQHRILKAIL